MSGTPARKFFTIAVVIAVVAILVPFGVSCSKPPAPTAAFNVTYVTGQLLIADPIAGLAPLTIQLTDNSSGKITSWRWNLGDGSPIVQGSDEASRNFTHEYQYANSSGYTVTLTVKGPGGSDTKSLYAAAVLSCSEAANVELNQAKTAITACKGTANTLDKYGVWDGSRGIVVAGGRDAVDYLGVWKTFKATYVVAQDGTITSGTDVSWTCVYWNTTSLGARWTGITK